MEKRKNDHDFTQPTRQSYASILIISYRLYKVIARQLFPLIIIVLIQGEIAKSVWFIYPVIAIAVLGALYSIAAFFKYFFYISGEKLVVEKGVFKRSILEIPFDRIQSINFEQNLIHRLFGVVKLHMDTAGSATSELELSALDRTVAKQLSGIILSVKKKRDTPNDTISDNPGQESSNLIFRLGLGQLLKVGVTENHIRSGGIIFFFIFYIYESLEEVGVNIMEKGEQYIPVAKQLAQSAIVVLVLAILFMVVAFFISIFRTVLNYYDLKMKRDGQGFVVESGLLNRREKAAKDVKVQLIKSAQNWLQKWSGIHELVLKQASSVAVSDARSIKVVGLSAEDIKSTWYYILGRSFSELAVLKSEGVEFYYLYRRLFYITLLFVPLSLLCYFSTRWDLLIILILAFGLSLRSAWLAYRKKKFAIGNNIIKLEGGVFGNNTRLLEVHKVQSLRIEETYFQTRRGLASINIQTASGTVHIPDIKKERAVEILNYLLERVETSKRKWM